MEQLIEGKKRRRWSREETIGFLRCYNARKEEFLHPKKKRLAYSNVLEDMASIGIADPAMTPLFLESKMRTLLDAYKTARCRKTGASTSFAPYMELMEEIYGDSPIISKNTPIKVTSSTGHNTLANRKQCRACRKFNCEEIMDMSYVVPTDGKTLYDYFNDCTQLIATARDGLPKILCKNCTQNLQQAYDFRQEARKSDDELKRALVLAESETTLACDSTVDQSEVLQESEAETYDVLSAPTKNESLMLCDTTEQCEDLKDVDSLATIDPLTMLKEEIKNELSDDMSEDSNEEQLDDSKNDANDYRKLRRKSDMSEDSNEEQFDESKNHVNNYRKLRRKLRRKHSFECDICAQKYRKKHELVNHVFELHKDRIICEECSKVYELPAEMDMHKKLVHSTDPDICCPWCETSDPMKKDMLTKHIQTNHSWNYTKYFPRLRELCRGEDDPLQCECCAKVFPSIYELADHLHNSKFDCPMCSMSFKRFCGYKSHMQRIHDQIVYSNRAIFAEDRRSNKQFECRVCNKAFKLRDNLQRHMYNKHKRKENVYHARTRVEVRRLKKRNLNGINNEKTYICTYCPRQFSSRGGAQSHEEKVHHGGTSLRMTCPICQKEVDASYLNDHIKIRHTSEPKLDCDICGDLFKTHSQLNSHKNRKHLNRKHPCTVCNKQFVAASELKVHMRMHTGETPYECHICHQRFKIRGALTYHLQQHAGIKHKCKVCGKEFNMSSLRIHLYTHTGMPYRCHLCEFGHHKRYQFKEHLLRGHGTTLTETELSDMFKANTGRYSRFRLDQVMETIDGAMQDTDNSG